MKQIIILILVIWACSSHSTFYPIAERNKTCVQPQPAKIWSWHIHLLFFENNPGNVNGAIQVRNQFMEKFKHILHKDLCPSLAHQNYNCMFDIDTGAAGPFPTSQWAVYLLPEYLTEAMTWMLQNRDGYDILIHPNSGCSLEDHSDWAIFGGNKWELNMGAFRSDIPYQKPPFNLTQHQQENLEKKPYLKDFLDGGH